MGFEASVEAAWRDLGKQLSGSDLERLFLEWTKRQAFYHRCRDTEAVAMAGRIADAAWNCLRRLRVESSEDLEAAEALFDLKQPERATRFIGCPVETGKRLRQIKVLRTILRRTRLLVRAGREDEAYTQIHAAVERANEERNVRPKLMADLLIERGHVHRALTSELCLRDYEAGLLIHLRNRTKGEAEALRAYRAAAREFGCEDEVERRIAALREAVRARPGPRRRQREW